MPNSGKVDTPPTKARQVSWRISEALRHRLTSHAEYLSLEIETDTETMVADWLEERLAVEERKRSLSTLGIDERDLPKRAR